MSKDLDWLNQLPPGEATTALQQCCGSARWAQQMIAARPYQNLEELIRRANDIWWSLDHRDWVEAFRSHPKIGERKAAQSVSTQTREWSGQEQAGVSNASQQTITSLAALNRAYEEKFGFIFIICATGKSPDEMLSALRERLDNEADAELKIAAAEQNKITGLRLKKLLAD
jgi:OHCU decarboxylase